MYKIFLLAILLLPLNSCKKEDKIINEGNNQKKTRGLGNGFMGVFYDEFPNYNYQNAIASINTNDGQLSILPLIKFGTNISVQYDDFKCVGISYIPVILKSVYMEGKKESLIGKFDLVIIAERITFPNKECVIESFIILANSLDGSYVFGPHIDNGFKYCEYDFINNKLVSINRDGYWYTIDINNGQKMLANSDHPTNGNYYDGVDKGFYIDNFHSVNRIGYLYHDINTISNPMSNYAQHFLGEEQELSLFYGNIPGNWANGAFPYVSTNLPNSSATSTTIEDLSIATKSKSIEVFDNFGYVSYLYYNGESYTARLAKFDKFSISNNINFVFSNQHVLEDMTDH